jgi:RNA polymerase sigma-70 factor, ECF subfamily
MGASIVPRDIADDRLIEALARQDVGALESFYDRYGKVAYALAYRIVGERGVAEDVVQDAFISIWRQARSYRPERGSPKTWLMAIVRNRSIDKLRSHAAGAASVSIDEVPEDFGAEPGPWQQVWNDLRGATVRDALERLPVEQKKSIELAYFSGYSQSEIAGLMGVPLGTVKGRMRIGLQKLKAMLETPELGVSGA